MPVRVPSPFDEGVTRHFVCANCWGDLYSRWADGRDDTGRYMTEVKCSTPGCPCHGFVSKNFIERLETIARIERYTAYDDLREILPWVRQLGPTPDVGYPWDPETETYAIPVRKSTVFDNLNF